MSALADNPGSRPKSARLGEILIEHGLIDAEQLAIALADQQVSGDLLGAILIERGFAARPRSPRRSRPSTAGCWSRNGSRPVFGPVADRAEQPEPAAAEAAPLRFSPQLVEASPPAAVPAAAAEDPRLAELARERDQLSATLVKAAAEIERLAAENAAAFGATPRSSTTGGSRRSTGLRPKTARSVEQLAELTAERDAARAAAPVTNDGFAARVAELEVLLARVTNRSSAISERLDELIGDVARLHERLGTGETVPPAIRTTESPSSRFSTGTALSTPASKRSEETGQRTRRGGLRAQYTATWSLSRRGRRRPFSRPSARCRELARASRAAAPTSRVRSRYGRGRSTWRGQGSEPSLAQCA